jgi:hypothetical protein
MRLIEFLDSFYSKLPSFGHELRDFIVKVFPFLAIITGVIVVFSSLVDLLGTPFLNSLTSGGGATIFQKLMIVNILGVIEGVFMILAFRGLRRKKRSGWRLILWSQIIFIVSALLSFSPSFLLGFIFLYPLFQIRTNYR